VRRTLQRRSEPSSIVDLPNEFMSPLFQAAIEATEEAIYNALFMATTITGCGARTVAALPVEKVVGLLMK